MAPPKLRRDFRRPALLLALQLAVLGLLWKLMCGAGECKDALLGIARATGPQLPPPLPLAPPSLKPSSSARPLSPLPPVSPSMGAIPGATFQAPHSRCQVLQDGSVRPTSPKRAVAGGRNTSPTSLPFLFDTTTMPGRKEACSHCPADESRKLPTCCGVCIFTDRRCDDFFPGQNRAQAAAKVLLGMHPQMQAFTPCELFQRIRGRTLWFMGDSQTWNLFYAAECFLREFAPSLRRTPALTPEAKNLKLVTRPPPEIPPLCLDLVLGTRVCGVRLYRPGRMADTVLPQLLAHAPNFKHDLVVFNFGLHFHKPGGDGTPANQSVLVQGLLGLAQWRRQHAAQLPQMVWMDTPAQHFDTPDGSWPGGTQRFACCPLKAWHAGVPAVTAGGPFNTPIAPIVPQLADAHLRVFNASVPLWRQHWPGECTHFCHPSAYQHWLFLLNEVLRDKRLGNSVALEAAAEEGGEEGRLAAVAAAVVVAAQATKAGAAARPVTAAGVGGDAPGDGQASAQVA